MGSIRPAMCMTGSGDGVLARKLTRRHQRMADHHPGAACNKDGGQLGDAVWQDKRPEDHIIAGPMLLDRQRKLSREGHAVLERWVREQEGRFNVSQAVATSIAFVGYNFDMPSAELANHIREKASVLVAPGGYLGTENHLRITVGYEPEKVRTALKRIDAVAAELAQMASTAHS